MPGFLSKIFGRKDKTASPNAKQAKQRGRAAKREKQQQQSASKPSPKAASSPLAAVGPRDEADGLLARSPSFTATTASGRESSILSREQATNKPPNSKKQAPTSKPTSPRNAAGTPNARPRTKKTTPVDLDDTDFEESDRDEDHAGLSFQQLQQFNMQNTTHTPKQLYSLADNDRPSPRQAGSENSSHSDFNLSTDAEDEEYNSLKRNVASYSVGKAVPPVSDVLEKSGASQHYTTDEDNGIFSALNTDDEGPSSTPEDEPGRIKIVSAPSHHEADEDMRAWGLSPSTGSSGKENGLSPHQQKVSQKSKPSRSFAPPPKDDFANFANFDADFENAFPGEPILIPPTPTSEPPPSRRHFDDEPQHTQRSALRRHHSSAGSANADSSLPDLLAQAKKVGGGSRRSNANSRGSSSVNSAPAITAQYLRQYHGLTSRSETQTKNDTSVSDIIQSLEATNAARLRNRSARSVGSRDSGANASVRSAKERIRERRRREREGGSTAPRRQRSSQNGGSDESEDNDPSDSWLFDEVTGALGPRGVTADMESLSGRSNRSRNSGGGRSSKSHRSQRSSRQRGTKSSSNESVDSRGSKNSRNSRNSRYSHKSTRSYLSQMSEQSRSVANDLLRLEMQLAMVGSQENGDGDRAGGESSGSVASRTSRASRNSTSTRRSSAITKRSKINVTAPPGKLGIILANKADSKGTVVSGVRTSSVLAEKISPGDRIIAIDGEDVSRMTVSEITTIMARKSEFERSLTVLTTPKHMTRATDSMGIDPEGTTYQTFRR